MLTACLGRSCNQHVFSNQYILIFGDFVYFQPKYQACKLMTSPPMLQLQYFIKKTMESLFQ
jgi:hypothetical protein